MDTMNLTAIGVIMALIEIIKQVIVYFTSKKDNENNKLDELYELLKKTDTNGIPLCYHQRSISELQQVQTLESIRQTMEKMSYLQENFMAALEKMALVLEKINDRQVYDAGRSAAEKK